MKALILIFLLPVGSFAACLQDSLSLKDEFRLDMKSLESTVENFQVSIENSLPHGHALVIRLDSLSSRVNADVVKEGNQIVIQIFGGMLRHESMNPDVLMLLLCHEIGHFLGGPPLKSRNGWSSTEGQSDYFSGMTCSRVLNFDESTFIEAAMALTGIYAQVGRESIPRADSCDARVVERTNFGYPSAQCRLDTLMAGRSGIERP